MCTASYPGSNPSFSLHNPESLGVAVFLYTTQKAWGWGGVESGNKAIVSLVKFPTASANFSVNFANFAN